MQTRVREWGNSLAVRIPKAFADEAGLETNSPVELVLQDGEIIIRAVRKKKYHLEDLVAQITDENLHSETDTGAPVGNEVW
jgi:antitoxin MazE